MKMTEQNLDISFITTKKSGIGNIDPNIPYTTFLHMKLMDTKIILNSKTKSRHVSKSNL